MAGIVGRAASYDELPAGNRGLSLATVVCGDWVVLGATAVGWLVLLQLFLAPFASEPLYKRLLWLLVVARLVYSGCATGTSSGANTG